MQLTMATTFFPASGSDHQQSEIVSKSVLDTPDATSGPTTHPGELATSSGAKDFVVSGPISFLEKNIVNLKKLVLYKFSILEHN